MVFDNGEIITGCNVENASYSCTICAERCAIFSAVVLGKDLTKVQEVYIQSDQSILFYPCGACLQVMAEFLKTRTIVKVLAKEKEGKKLTAQYTLKELLPHCFKI